MSPSIDATEHSQDCMDAWWTRGAGCICGAVRRLFYSEPELSTNERMRRVLGRPTAEEKPTWRVFERSKDDGTST